MVWDYDLETHHAGIDQDHQEIVAFLAAFLKVVDTGHHERVPGVLAALYDRVARHFDYEERLMVELGIPDVRSHTEAHQAFLKDIRRWAEVAGGGVSEAFRQWAHGRLVSWFRQHIMAYDIALARAVAPAAGGGGTARG